MVNPLDPLELKPFLRNLKEEMPIHTETTAKIKRSYSQGMPKNLMEYSAFVNNHFLNDNLAIIEEMQHRNKAHPIPKWFRDYQIRHYAKHGILKGDHFFGPLARIFPDLGEHRAIGFLPYAGVTLGFGIVGDTKVLGAELEAYTSGTTIDDTIGTTQLIASLMATPGNIGDWYNQVAVKRGTTGSGGNGRGGIYSQSGGLPNVLYGETASTAFGATGSYTYWDLTNGGAPLTTTDVWVAFCVDSTSSQLVRLNPGNASAKLRANLSHTYGALDNPFVGSPYSEDGNNFLFKCRGN